MPIAILMPAYNETTALTETLRKLGDRVGAPGADRAAPSADAPSGGATVFLVDDGSDPPLDAAALPRNIHVVLARHPFNLGQGAALETARQLALRDPRRDAFDAYVTMDADGQHRVEDAVALAEAIADGADVAFGNRFLGSSNVPGPRRALLGAARFFEWAITGLRLADSHNGLRAFSRRAIEQVPIRQNRMAHATEIKQRVSRAGELVIVEVPVSVRYTRQSLAKGQRSLGAVVIVRDLVLQYLFGEP
ncbi:MAG: glycosyltransferase family 2 protein [Polyangiaceae bacterium]